jgi:hypothetical protein
MLRRAFRVLIHFAAATRQQSRRSVRNFYAQALWQDPGERRSRTLARVQTGRGKFTKPSKREPELQPISFGDLNGSHPDKSKWGYNIAGGPWIRRLTRWRSGCSPSDNHIRLHAVDPRGTSRMCRGCDVQDRRNRNWETFGSIADEGSNNADFIGLGMSR